MPYLNIDFGFPDHIKTRRLAGLIGGNAEAEGLLVRLWCHIGGHHGDAGRLPGYTAQEVEAIVRWVGAAGAFVEALCKVGFLHRDGDGFRVHDWKEHQGHIGALRARAKTAAAARWQTLSGDASSIATRTPKHRRKQSSLPSKPSMPADEKTETKESGGTAAPVESSSLAVPKEKPQHVEFVDRWCQFYESQVGEPFKQERAHFVISSRLIKDHGLDAAVQKAKVLAVLCSGKSAWFTKDGWGSFTLETLSKHWNRILPQSHQPSKEEEFLAEMKKQEELRGKANAVHR